MLYNKIYMTWCIIYYDVIYDTIYDMMIWYMMWYDMIWYLIWYMIYLTAIGLTPGKSSTVHIYTQTVHRTTQSTQTIHRTTQFTN
jgi:hypothetical protein